MNKPDYNYKQPLDSVVQHGFEVNSKNSNYTAATQQFCKSLNDALRNNFASLPSAADFAKQFNARATGTSTISRETARKWMRGHCIPNIGRLTVLVSWLNMNVDGFLGAIQESQTSERDNYLNSQSKTRDSSNITELVEIAGGLDTRGVLVLIDVAKSLSKQNGKR